MSVPEYRLNRVERRVPEGETFRARTGVRWRWAGDGMKIGGLFFERATCRSVQCDGDTCHDCGGTGVDPDPLAKR